jgi:hypothetical protein
MVRVVKWTILSGWILLLSPCARAQCLPAVCALTVLVQSDAAGITLGGSGTSAASMSFGTVRAFGGTVPTGVTKVVGGTDFTLSTPFDIKVTCTNLLTLLPCTLLLTPTYTLTAQLQTTDTTNTWKISGTTLSSTTPITLQSAGSYAAVNAYTFALTIPFTEAAGTISNTINFLAVSN